MLFLQAAEWIYIKTPSRELCELALTLSIRRMKKTIVRRGSLQNMACLMLAINSELQSKTFEEFEFSAFSRHAMFR